MSARHINPVFIEIARQEQQRHPACAISLLTEAGELLYTTLVMESVIGYTPEEVIGRNIDDFIVEYDMPHATLAMQDALLNDKSVEIGFTARTKQGVPVHAHGQVFLLTDPDTGEIMLLSHVRRTSGHAIGD